MTFFLNAGQGATICLINTLFAKLYMTVFWRFKIVLSVLSGGKKSRMRDIVESAPYKAAHSFQLNEAEWSPVLLGCLLFAHTQSMEVDLAATLAALGSVWYFWLGMMFGFPLQSPGAAMRYVALALLCRDFYYEFFP